MRRMAFYKGVLVLNMGTLSIIFQSIAAISLIASGIYNIGFRKPERKLNHLIIGWWEVILALVILAFFVLLPIGVNLGVLK